MDAAVADELRERQPGDLAAHRIEAAEHDRVGRVVDDEVDAGGLLEGADVAPLAADDAALHLVGRDGHRGHRGLSGVVDHDALDGGDDDIASAVLGVLASGALDGPDEAHGVVLGLLAHLLDEDRLGLLRREAADALERLDLLAPGSWPARCAGSSSSCSRQEQLAIALLEHVGALVELLVALEEAPLEVGEVVALGATLLVQPRGGGGPVPPWPGG